jgi:hypothetical protein
MGDGSEGLRGEVSEMAGRARQSRPCATNRHLVDLPGGAITPRQGATSLVRLAMYEVHP